MKLNFSWQIQRRIYLANKRAARISREMLAAFRSYNFDLFNFDTNSIRMARKFWRVHTLSRRYPI